MGTRMKVAETCFRVYFVKKKQHMQHISWSFQPKDVAYRHFVYGNSVHSTKSTYHISL